MLINKSLKVITVKRSVDVVLCAIKKYFAVTSLRYLMLDSISKGYFFVNFNSKEGAKKVEKSTSS
jgi:hypothetical protein